MKETMRENKSYCQESMTDQECVYVCIFMLGYRVRVYRISSKRSRSFAHSNNRSQASTRRREVNNNPFLQNYPLYDCKTVGFCKAVSSHCAKTIQNRRPASKRHWVNGLRKIDRRFASKRGNTVRCYPVSTTLSQDKKANPCRETNTVYT